MKALITRIFRAATLARFATRVLCHQVRVKIEGALPFFGRRFCKCEVLERASKEADHPIRWDEQMNEYYIAYGKSGQMSGRMSVYYCPFCGGKTPKSRRHSFFAHVTREEETRIYGLFREVRTVADVVARFGPPDAEHENAEAVRIPSAGGKPECGQAFRGLFYRSLSPVAEIVFVVGTNDSVIGTWHAKDVSNKTGSDFLTRRKLK